MKELFYARLKGRKGALAASALLFLFLFLAFDLVLAASYRFFASYILYPSAPSDEATYFRTSTPLDSRLSSFIAEGGEYACLLEEGSEAKEEGDGYSYHFRAYAEGSLVFGSQGILAGSQMAAVFKTDAASFPEGRYYLSSLASEPTIRFEGLDYAYAGSCHPELTAEAAMNFKTAGVRAVEATLFFDPARNLAAESGVRSFAYFDPSGLLPGTSGAELNADYLESIQTVVPMFYFLSFVPLSILVLAVLAASSSLEPNLEKEAGLFLVEGMGKGKAAAFYFLLRLLAILPAFLLSAGLYFPIGLASFGGNAVLLSLAYPFQLLYVAALSFAFASHKAHKARKRLRF